MSGKRSLLDDIQDLIDPTPVDIDPETQDVDTAARLPGADAQLERLADDLARVPAGKRLPMRAGIQLDDEAYRGRKTSRKNVFEEDAFDSDDGEDGQAPGEGEDGEDDDDEMSSGEFDEDEGDDEDDDSDDAPEEARTKTQSMKGTATGGKRKRDDGDDDGHSGDDDGDDDDDEMDGDEDEDEDAPDEDAAGGARGSMGSEEGEEMKELEREYQALQQAEGQAVAAMQDKGRKEAEKGRAARSQQMLYERMLEIRILLQKPLMGSNRLPLPDLMSTLVTQPHKDHQKKPHAQAEGHGEGQHAQQANGHAEPSGPPTLHQRVLDFKSAATETLTQLVELFDSFTSNNKALCHGAVPVSQEKAHPKHQPSAVSDAYWNSITSRFDNLKAFRDASIDRWHARAVLGSGASTLQGSLRALNQSVSKQVSNMLQDPFKLIQRSRVLKGPGYKHLGDKNTDLENGGDADVDGNADVYGAAQERDDETYDDGEFYQQLLKEFLDQTGGNAKLSAAAKATKRRKVVDRRASKGRKIRYNVQDKLVNFMSAVHMEPPVFADQLFANLFGHAANGK